MRELAQAGTPGLPDGVTVLLCTALLGLAGLFWGSGAAVVGPWLAPRTVAGRA